MPVVRRSPPSHKTKPRRSHATQAPADQPPTPTRGSDGYACATDQYASPGRSHDQRHRQYSPGSRHHLWPGRQRPSRRKVPRHRQKPGCGLVADRLQWHGGLGFRPVGAASNAEAVAVAQNIPAAPPPQPTQPPAPPTNTPAQPAAPANTPEPPKPQYKFNVVVVSKCERQPAGNWFEGKTYINGQPQSGYKVVFGTSPGGPRDPTSGLRSPPGLRRLVNRLLQPHHQCHCPPSRQLVCLGRR